MARPLAVALRPLAIRPALLLACLVAAAHGANPIVPNVGMADPHAHIFEDRVFIYATHDASPNNTGFGMRNWWQWSSADFVHWSLDSYVFPNSSTPGAEWMAHTAAADGVCWATDAASRGGQYYFYLSVGSTAIGVVSGPTPKGPWHDPLGQALLANGSSYSPSTEIRDPAVYADPADGSYYIVFGTFNYYIAKLNEDMISLAEQPRYIHVNNIWAGQNGPNRTDDKPFLHSHTQPARGEVPAAPRYYLSYGAFYAISDSPYGPYEFVGTFIAPAKIAPDFRMPIDPEQPWYKQLDYKDRHGSFMTLHNQWYFVCNDLSHSLDKQNPNSYRDTVIAYAHYLANGSIAPLAINATGVGRYDASQRIEAEHYFKLLLPHNDDRAAAAAAAAGYAHKRQVLPQAGRVEGSEDLHYEFEVAGLEAGASLHYPNFFGLNNSSAIRHEVRRQEEAELALRVAGCSGVEVTVHATSGSGDNEDGDKTEPKVLGRCALDAGPANAEQYGDVVCTLTSPVGTAGVVLQFTAVSGARSGVDANDDDGGSSSSGGGGGCRLDSFQLLQPSIE